MKFLALILSLSIISNLYARENAGVVSKVIGNAYIQVKDHKKALSKGDKVVEGDTVITSKKSFLLLKFDDSTKFQLGESSKLVVQKNRDESGPGMLYLLNGQLRSTSTKTESSGNKPYKYFLRTRTASMGVRGTDLEISYNDQNRITSTVTYSGDVLMRKSEYEHYFDDSITSALDRDEKDALLSSIADDLKDERTKQVKSGHFVGSYTGQDEATDPVKISPLQVDRRLGHSSISSNKKSTKSKNLRPTNDILVPTPDDLQDDKVQGDYSSVRPGGYLDFKTGIYISPPADAKFDEKKQVFEMPDEFGEVDDKGGYVPPEGFTLDPLKGFVLLSGVIMKVGKEVENRLLALNDNINQGIFFIKKLTRIDASLKGEYAYDSNVHEEFYDERRFVSNSPSQYLGFDGYLSRKIIDSRKWQTNFITHLRTKYYTRQDLLDVGRNDSASWDLILEAKKRKPMFGLLSNFYARAKYHIRYQDFRNEDDFLFYFDDSSAAFGFEFRPHRRHMSKFEYELGYYQEYRDEIRGLLHRIRLEHNVDMGRTFDFNINLLLQSREQEVLGQSIDLARISGELIHKHFIRKSKLYMQLSLQSYAPNSLLWSNRWSLKRKTGEFWTWEAYYMFEQQYDRNKFRRHASGANVYFVF